MIKIIPGNLFNTTSRYIAHQVNCLGVMGTGVAGQVKARYPEVYKQYNNLCMQCSNDRQQLLGYVQQVNVDQDRRIILNCFTQLLYGRNKRYTDYDAFEKCMSVIANNVRSGSVAMPYKIGSDAAGVEWEVIYHILEKYFSEWPGTLEIWRI